MTDDLETACYLEVRNVRPVDADSNTAETREKCGLCFPDREIPDDVDEVVVGRYTSKVHLSDDYDADGEATGPDNPVCAKDGLAAKIGAEDFGPEDIDDLASQGGDV